MNGIPQKEAVELLECEGPEVYELFARANSVRLKNRGMKVRLCGVINAKSGHCTEDCKFCAQSAHNDSKIECHLSSFGVCQMFFKIIAGSCN